MYYKGGVQNFDDTKPVPENENKYPEPGMFGQAPAYGFFMRHAENIKFTDVEISLLSPDSRPAFRADDVKGLVLRYVKAQKSDYKKIAVLNDVSGVEAIESLDLNK